MKATQQQSRMGILGYASNHTLFDSRSHVNYNSHEQVQGTRPLTSHVWIILHLMSGLYPHLFIYSIPIVWVNTRIPNDNILYVSLCPPVRF